MAKYGKISDVDNRICDISFASSGITKAVLPGEGLRNIRKKGQSTMSKCKSKVAGFFSVYKTCGRPNIAPKSEVASKN